MEEIDRATRGRTFLEEEPGERPAFGAERLARVAEPELDARVRFEALARALRDGRETAHERGGRVGGGEKDDLRGPSGGILRAQRGEQPA